MQLLINLYRDSYMWVIDPGPVAMHEPYKSNEWYFMQKHLWCKTKVRPSEVESYLEVNHEQIGNNKICYQNMAKT